MHLHSVYAEGAGIGMFLSMRSTQLIIIRGNRVSMAPSLYLDQHGEVCSDLTFFYAAVYGSLTKHS